MQTTLQRDRYAILRRIFADEDAADSVELRATFSGLRVGGAQRSFLDDSYALLTAREVRGLLESR